LTSTAFTAFTIKQSLVFLALAAWAITFVGLLRTLARAISAHYSRPSRGDA
jgi:hypothetical protein